MNASTARGAAHAARPDVGEVLARIRAATAEDPPSGRPHAQGPNYDAEAAREAAIEDMVRLGTDAEPLLVTALEDVLRLLEHDGREYYCCEALVRALVLRRAWSAVEVLRRIALDTVIDGWVPTLVVQLVAKWDSEAFAPLFREVLASSSSGHLRSWAAEMLVQSGRATPEEIDGFLVDEDDGVQRLTARGLATLANGDAIARLAQRATGAPDDRARRQARCLLDGMMLTVSRGGEC
jgi:HEAT repeat protein